MFAKFNEVSLKRFCDDVDDYEHGTGKKDASQEVWKH